MSFYVVGNATFKPLRFYRTVDFIYVDFNLLPHMKKLPYSLFFAAFGQFLLAIMDISS